MTSSACGLEGGAGGAGGYGGFDFNGADMGDIFGDIFGDFFGGGRSAYGRSSNGPMRGANLRTGVRITFEEAIFGCEKEIELTLKDECPKCHGTGAKPGTSPVTCRNVTVKARSSTPSSPSSVRYRMSRTCPDCRGTGKIVKEKCPDSTVPDISPARRRSRSRSRQVSTTDRASASQEKESLERTAAREETFSLR